MATIARFESHKPNYILSSRDLILAGKMVRRPDEIPLDSINFDDLIVDQNHVLKLAQDMRGPMGQHSAISARARLVEDQIVHDVLDGAHRASAARILREETGSDTMSATVFHCVSDRVFLQQRALAINSVASLKWPRYGTWCTGVWQQSPWANRGLRLHQVFELAAKSKPHLSKTGLDRDEARAIVTWGRQTASDIQERPGVLAQIFRTVDYAAPDLVRNARTPDPGVDARAMLTPSRLELVVAALPDQEFHPAQRAVMRVIMEEGLRTRDARALVQSAAQVLQPGMKEDEVYAIVKDLKIDTQQRARSGRPSSAAKEAAGKSSSDTRITSLQRELEGSQAALREAKAEIASFNYNVTPNTRVAALEEEIARLKLDIGGAPALREELNICRTNLARTEAALRAKTGETAQANKVAHEAQQNHRGAQVKIAELEAQIRAQANGRWYHDQAITPADRQLFDGLVHGPDTISSAAATRHQDLTAVMRDLVRIFSQKGQILAARK